MVATIGMIRPFDLNLGLNDSLASFFKPTTLEKMCYFYRMSGIFSKQKSFPMCGYHLIIIQLLRFRVDSDGNG